MDSASRTRPEDRQTRQRRAAPGSAAGTVAISQLKRDMARSAALYELDVDNPDAMPGAGEIANYAVRTIRSGDIIEMEAYPVFKRGTRSGDAVRRGGTREAQRKVNERNRRKHIVRYVNANFGQGDVVITLTYAQAPESEARAISDMRNYIARLKRLHARMVRCGQLPEGHSFKWLYTTETASRDGRPVRVHHHLVLNIPDRDALEACWQHGRANARRLQPDKFALTALALYMTKALRHSMRFSHSRNLARPQETYAQRKLSRRRALAIIQDMDAAAPEILGRLYPGCEFLSCDIKLSEFAQGGYIHAVMRRGPAGQG